MIAREQCKGGSADGVGVEWCVFHTTAGAYMPTDIFRFIGLTPGNLFIDRIIPFPRPLFSLLPFRQVLFPQRLLYLAPVFSVRPDS